MAANNNTENKCFEKVSRILEIKDINERINAFKDIEKECLGSGYYELELGSAFVDASEHEKARDVWEVALRSKIPFAREIKYRLMDHYFLFENLGRAETLAIELVNEYPDWNLGFAGKGYVNLAQNKLGAAIEALVKSLELEDNPDTLSLLVVALHQADEHEAAVKFFNQALDMDLDVLKRQHIAVFSAATSLMKLNYLEQAESLLANHLKVRAESKDDNEFKRAVAYLKTLKK